MHRLFSKSEIGEEILETPYVELNHTNETENRVGDLTRTIVL